MMQMLPNDQYLFLHLAGVVSFTALALKDQLKLRAVLLASTIFLMIFHYSAEETPGWHEIFWDSVEFSINMVVLIQLILDGTQIGLSAEEEELFNALKFLSPGEFRALIKAGTWETAPHKTELTTEGVVPDDLFYVLRGDITIAKGGREFSIEPRAFIGEVAFMHNSPASATVRLSEGARYLRWPVKKLEKQFQSKDSLRVAVLRIIGLDASSKVAKS